MKRRPFKLTTLLALVLGLASLGAEAQVSLGVNRLLVVSAAGSATQNCTGLRDTLAGITTTAADNPYVLRLEPGEYDCGATSLVMKSYVDLEGSGEGVTRVFGVPEGDPLVGDPEPAVVAMADQMELRFLTVEHLGDEGGTTDLCAAAAVSAGSGESRITHASLVAREALCNSCGLFTRTSATIRVADSSIKGDFEGILMQDGSSTVLVRGSTVEGANGTGVVFAGAGDVVLLAHSQLIHGFDTTQGGDLTCLYSYDGNLAELNSGCSPP
ncbi:MAG: right-handed parallel beta-helix repeat-containing protein [Acidobacteriota bacterium]|nr:right-handed parallel beta-helix repeat-containing protein [Acidobacteriota bacterium]